MSTSRLVHLLRDTGSFLQLDEAEFQRVLGERAHKLPLPLRIFLDDEEATPFYGFPVLLSSDVQSLRQALESYLTAESEYELDLALGRPGDRQPPDTQWEGYRALISKATANAVSSSFGRGYPSILWLYHSIAVSRVFKEIPRRLRRVHGAAGGEHGDSIKYRVFHRYLDRALEATYDEVQRAAQETEEPESELFPAVLEQMRDNVLILTEDHISPDLAELGAYFSGCLRADLRDFRERMSRLTAWHVRQLEGDQELRALIRSFLGLGAITGPWFLLIRPGYMRFLSHRPGYDPARFLDDKQVELWERLLLRLKEFEILAGLRRYVVPVREDDGRLTCPGAVLRRGAAAPPEITLSTSTRPLEFMRPWVVDPQVRRFGLIYDITDFSAIVSMLRRSGETVQDLSFRRIFGFQRRVNKIAQDHRLQLEKYLGDGALYSGRFPTRLLRAAILLQRFYRRALEEDFPFNRGLRMALNYGTYRLLPIEGGRWGGGQRYEFFGHGIVELSRLVTGKTAREIEEVKTFLLAHGYSDATVDKFFEPVMRKHVYLVDRGEENRPFYAYINASGALINEGIVATLRFAEQLELSVQRTRLGSFGDGTRQYVIFELEDEEPILVGMRKLGEAQLKGLGGVWVCEVVDAEGWRGHGIRPLASRSILEALEEQFAALVGSRDSQVGSGGAL